MGICWFETVKYFSIVVKMYPGNSRKSTGNHICWSAIDTLEISVRRKASMIIATISKWRNLQTWRHGLRWWLICFRYLSCRALCRSRCHQLVGVCCTQFAGDHLPSARVAMFIILRREFKWFNRVFPRKLLLNTYGIRGNGSLTFPLLVKTNIQCESKK